MVKITLELENKTDLIIEESYFTDFVEKIKMLLEKRLKNYLGEHESVLSLYLVKDSEIQRLNKEFREIDKPTDVLSFPYLEASENDATNEAWVNELSMIAGVVLAGEVFISVDTAEKQAKEKGHSLEKELSILFVHGMLHIFGFDHNNDEEEAEMEGWAEKILQ